MNELQHNLLNLVRSKISVSAREVESAFGASLRTTQRTLNELIKLGYLKTEGQSKNTKYLLTELGILNYPVDVQIVLSEQRLNNPVINFNHDIFRWVAKYNLQADEKIILNRASDLYRTKTKQASKLLKKKELERLIVEFSWKSSSFEGDTYTLLETENLIQRNIRNKAKPEMDAQIILNHKAALEFVFNNPDYFKMVSLKKIQELHTILVRDLGVGTGFRKSGVGITGSLYKPLDNNHQIKEKIELTCQLINQTQDEFLKAMYSTLLLSYIQPFEDGNKRTSRLLANAILFSYNLPLLSYRNTKVEDYRNAVIAFYELNSLFLFKNIFIEQIQFCAEFYF